MGPLKLDLFLNPYQDFEKAQYQVLGALQQSRVAFSRNVIYPHLGWLIHLHEQLETIAQQFEQLRASTQGDVEGIDLEAARVLRRAPELGDEQLHVIEELIRWSIPHIREAIEEGRTIFEFVDEHSELEEVGLVPSYTDEGYLIVPDPQAELVHILQYTMSIYTGADEQYRSLKTTHVKSLREQNVRVPPSAIKMELLSERRDLPNPATYFCEVGLDFPYEPTMLPVAKRKLMRYLYEQGGSA